MERPSHVSDPLSDPELFIELINKFVIIHLCSCLFSASSYFLPPLGPPSGQDLVFSVFHCIVSSWCIIKVQGGLVE